MTTDPSAWTQPAAHGSDDALETIYAQYQLSERRARQLATLNELTRQLSTLDLEPLLHKILQGAVDILNCEAGSLLLVDEDTDELVFRVANGPVAVDLEGKRIPPGRGIVGKAIADRQAIIANDVQSLPEWFSKNDQRTGFITRALIVHPLEVKDRITGVIEVINKRDGSPFGQEDTDLLAAFAGQAAVAIENARLYTLTDRALSARVEELSVMQRIDRELNASLDARQTMDITLKWAMRQSGAEAGLIGSVAEDGLRVISAEGYQTELDPYPNRTVPMGTGFVQTAIQSEEMICLPVPTGSPSAGVLAGARSQLIAPIRQEDRMIGLLLLETTQDHACPDEALAFLVRLCDHAAIAIANSQLYAAVQAANQAKSDFVSFVSHELKNPMTAIRGYTELLSNSAAGPVNETQAKFLQTISSNVERMATLVSDLADVSRIEAGRLKVELGAVALEPAIDEVLRSNRRLLDEKRHQVETCLPADLPALHADRIRLVQVLANLVSNAAKYTPAGGVITVGAERCACGGDIDEAPELVHIWVKDTGVGISPEEQAKIFQKFFRSENPQLRDVPGTGLGLNITRTLVEMQGGRIWFESQLQSGTTFHLELPAIPNHS